MNVARTSPCARATPMRPTYPPPFAIAMTPAPAPMKPSASVPTNSATACSPMVFMKAPSLTAGGNCHLERVGPAEPARSVPSVQFLLHEGLARLRRSQGQGDHGAGHAKRPPPAGRAVRVRGGERWCPRDRHGLAASSRRGHRRRDRLPGRRVRGGEGSQGRRPSLPGSRRDPAGAAPGHVAREMVRRRRVVREARQPLRSGGDGGRVHRETQGGRVKLKVVHTECGREILVRQILDPGGHCPWDGKPFNKDYTAILAEALETAENAGGVLENALEKIADMEPSMTIDRDSVLRGIEQQINQLDGARRRPTR